MPLILTTIADTFVKVKDIKIQSTKYCGNRSNKVYVYNLSVSMRLQNFVNNKLYLASKFSGILDESKILVLGMYLYSNTLYKIVL